MSKQLKIAIFGDTHIRPENDDSQFSFKSDYFHTAQAKKAVDAIIAAKPDFVIHLGDVVHPIPTLASHKNALDVAKKMFDKFDIPFYVVPGNHDIGDKKNTSNAPKVDLESRTVFEQYWNKTYFSFDKNNHHFIILDSILLGFDDVKAKAQKEWLINDLEKNKDKRTFLFLHFPPFLLDKNEMEHYDNLPNNARNWLLDTIEKYKLEAVFSGHVHRFFYNKIKETKFYTLPATSFVRPEYANLNTIKPHDLENGRADKEQLGISFLTIDENDHLLEIDRIFSKYPNKSKSEKNIGVWLHKKIGSVFEIPYSDLDLLDRKYARNDNTLTQLINLGINNIRIPIEDLEDKAVVERIDFLANYNINLTVFSNGIPKQKQLDFIEKSNKILLEVVLKPSDYELVMDNLELFTSDKIFVSRIGKSIKADSNYHSHFPRVGFNPFDEKVVDFIKISEHNLYNFAFKLDADEPYQKQFEQVLKLKNEYNITCICHFELPFKSEAEIQADDDLIAKKCLEAVKISAQHPSIIFFLDHFYDKDRGYWCRNGLLTNSDLPRLAYQILKQY